MKLHDLLQATIDMNASDLRVEDRMIPIGEEKLSGEAVDQIIDSILDDEQRQAFAVSLSFS